LVVGHLEGLRDHYQFTVYFLDFGLELLKLLEVRSGKLPCSLLGLRCLRFFGVGLKLGFNLCKIFLDGGQLLLQFLCEHFLWGWGFGMFGD
jgi:hypothetical protein